MELDAGDGNEGYVMDEREGKERISSPFPQGVSQDLRSSKEGYPALPTNHIFLS